MTPMVAFLTQSRIGRALLVVFAVLLLVVLWSTTRANEERLETPARVPTDVTASASAQETESLGSWGIVYPFSELELNEAADQAAAYVTFVGSYGPETVPSQWRSTVLGFYPSNGSDQRYLPPEPDWPSVVSFGVEVVTEVTGVSFLSASQDRVTVEVASKTNPSGSGSTAVSLVPTGSGWKVDSVAGATRGESGIEG